MLQALSLRSTLHCLISMTTSLVPATCNEKNFPSCEHCYLEVTMASNASPTSALILIKDFTGSGLTRCSEAIFERLFVLAEWGSEKDRLTTTCKEEVFGMILSK